MSWIRIFPALSPDARCLPSGDILLFIFVKRKKCKQTEKRNNRQVIGLNRLLDFKADSHKEILHLAGALMDHFP